MAPPPGKIIIVTGSSRGIGLAISRYLLDRHARLVVVSRSKEPLEQLRADYPGHVEVVAGNLTDSRLIQSAVDTAISVWGGIDGVVLNHATLAPVKRIAEIDIEDARWAFEVNFFSVVAIVQAALPALRQSKGRIIITSSGAAITAYSGWGSYGASKAAVKHLALTLGAEEPEVTTIALRPGVVDTDMQKEIREFHHEHMDEKDNKKFADLKETGGLLRPEQPGNVIARLVLDAPKELSGSFINWNAEELAAFQDS